MSAKMLGVSTKILRVWDNEGKVEAVRTAGGHRRYRISEIEKLQGIKHEEVKKPDKEIVAQKPANILKDALHFADDYTIILCLTVDTLRCWWDKGVFDLIDTIGGHGIDEVLGVIGEKSSKVDGGRSKHPQGTRRQKTPTRTG